MKIFEQRNNSLNKQTADMYKPGSQLQDKLSLQQQQQFQNLPPSGPLSVNINNLNSQNVRQKQQGSFMGSVGNVNNTINTINNASNINSTTNGNSTIKPIQQSFQQLQQCQYNENKENLNILEQQYDQIKQENRIINRKLNFLNDLVENSKTFDSCRNLIDLKQFVRECYGKFGDLVDQLYKEKHKNGELLNNYKNFEEQCKQNLEKEKEQIKKQQLQEQQQNSKRDSENKQEQMYRNEENNANIQFYVNTIKELEEKNKKLVKENDEFKYKNKQLNDQVQKKDFFKEYDKMVREVEGLRKQNTALAEKVKQFNMNKKSQSQQQQNNIQSTNGNNK